MATWQADFRLISPTGTLSSDYRARLDSILTRGRSWSEEIEQWGTEDGHRIDVSSDEAGSVDILARFDMRAPSAEVVERFLGFVRAEGLQISDAFGRPVPAELEEFTQALRDSPAFRFVEDPHGFLRRLRLGGQSAV